MRVRNKQNNGERSKPKGCGNPRALLLAEFFGNSVIERKAGRFANAGNDINNAVKKICIGKLLKQKDFGGVVKAGCKHIQYADNKILPKCLVFKHQRIFFKGIGAVKWFKSVVYCG